MEKIHSESGRAGESLSLVGLGLLNIILMGNLWVAAGFEPPLPNHPWLCFGVIILVAGGLIYCEVVLLACLQTLFTKVMQTAEVVASDAVERGEYWAARTAERSAAFALAALKFAALPVRIPCRFLWSAHIAPRLEHRRQHNELRRLYKEANTESSFDDFVRDFEGGTSHAKHDAAGDSDSKPQDDPFAAACALLGLPEAGGFSQAEFKARYQTLIKAVHPDAIGPNIFATQVNEARAVIKARKGWK